MQFQQPCPFLTGAVGAIRFNGMFVARNVREGGEK